MHDPTCRCCEISCPHCGANLSSPCDSLPALPIPAGELPYEPTAADWLDYAAHSPEPCELSRLERQLVDSIMLATARKIARDVPAAGAYLGVA